MQIYLIEESMSPIIEATLPLNLQNTWQDKDITWDITLGPSKHPKT